MKQRGSSMIPIVLLVLFLVLAAPDRANQENDLLLTQLFQKIFGEFSSLSFEDLQRVFDQPQECIMELTFNQAAKDTRSLP